VRHVSESSSASALFDITFRYVGWPLETGSYQRSNLTMQGKGWP